MPAGGGGMGAGGGILSPVLKAVIGGGGGQGGGGGGGGTDTGENDADISLGFEKLEEERHVSEVGEVTGLPLERLMVLPLVKVPVRVSSSMILDSRTLWRCTESWRWRFKAASSSSTSRLALRMLAYSSLIVLISVSSSANFKRDSRSSSVNLSCAWNCWKGIECIYVQVNDDFMFKFTKTLVSNTFCHI